MSNQLLPVWKQIEYYLDQSVSVIPVRDKDDANGVAKSPFGKSWKPYQTAIIKKDELYRLMEHHNTIAVGIVGGVVSQNLEIIDIDVKYNRGIDATLFSDLQTLYPTIYAKLRIHKSPSTGYHILYRCEVPVQGNQKLAGRNATAEELLANPKNKTYNFLETRGEGGYVLAPPSLGYSVEKDNPIPVLTQMERDSIIGLCKSYNMLMKIEKTFTPSKSSDSMYSLNPWDDYNMRIDPCELMSDLGWNEDNRNSRYIQFTRPGKNKGVSMSFKIHERFFNCFTSSTELDESKWYSPVGILILLKFQGDKAPVYQYLVNNGYGTMKPKVELSYSKKAISRNKPLPLNMSAEGIAAHTTLIEIMSTKYPYGIFWSIDEKNGVEIDRELLYRVSEGLGYKLHGTNLIHSDGTFIDEIDDRTYFDAIRAYIDEDDDNEQRDIQNTFEMFVERHGKFTISRLAMLPQSHILADTKDVAFKVYQNGILKITADDMDLNPTSDLLIWRKNLQPRNYNKGAGGMYMDFLKLATSYDTNSDYIRQCIGYLSHEFKDETTGYIVVLTEQCENPEDGGGAGKNVFSELFRKITTFISKPGSQTNFDEKFMQSWNMQKIFCISDVPKNFDFSFLKELSTGSGLMKKLYKDEYEIATDQMPKFLVQTNYSFENVDGGLKRRIRAIEFSDFFTKAGGIDVHFGCHFPEGWSEADWAGYDTLMAECIQYWLLSNRKIGSSILSESGWHKQFTQTFGQVISKFIAENIDWWVKDGWLSNDSFKSQLDKFYLENSIVHKPSTFNLNKGLKMWCSHHEIQYQCDILKKINGSPHRHKWFGKSEDTPF